MDVTTMNQLISAGSGLLGAIIGASISGFVTHKIGKDTRKYETESLIAGFLSEVDALQMIIRKRNYLESFSSFLDNPQIQSGTVNAFISILIPDNYAKFYNANMNKVGVLGPTRTRKLIRYHQILQAIVQDFHPESYFSKNGFKKDTLREDFDLLETALNLGDEILKE